MFILFPGIIQDAEGKTPIHLAIENQHPVIISLLLSHPSLNLTLKDKHGSTPFVAAMMTRNNKAAQAILDREPTAAEQVSKFTFCDSKWLCCAGSFSNTGIHHGLHLVCSFPCEAACTFLESKNVAILYFLKI